MFNKTTKLTNNLRNEDNKLKLDLIILEEIFMIRNINEELDIEKDCKHYS
jgi:hypothetical protein